MQSTRHVLSRRLRWWRAFPALRHRNFRLFLGGQFVSLCGTWMQSVAHGWLVLTLSNSPFLVGLVPALGGLPILLFTLYGGVLADRVDKHRFIIVLQAFMLCEAITLAVLTWRHWITVPWVIGIAIFFGFLTAFEVPARQAFVVEMVGKADLMNAIALNSTAFNVSRVIGPALAGILIAAAGIAACFAANALSYVGVIIGLLMMRWPKGEKPLPAAAGLRGPGFAEGFRFVAGEPWPRAIIILTAVFSIFGFSFIAMLPVYARDALGVGAGGYGLLVSSVGVGAAIGALTLAGLGGGTPQEQLALRTALAFGVVLVLAALMPHFWIAAALLMAAGCVMAVQGITANSYLQSSAPDHLRGRVMGFYSWVSLGLAPFGTLQAGWVAERWGVRASLVVGGGVCAACALVLRWVMGGRGDWRGRGGARLGV
ncbi:MAG TPA: MFS transporter [Gemmatimonadales bacterium]|nr:MFS transporter [Gemmatimonadales bacterium]